MSLLFKSFKTYLPGEVKDDFDDYSALPERNLKLLLEGLLVRDQGLKEIGIDEKYIQGVKEAIKKVLNFSVSTLQDEVEEIDLQNSPDIQEVYNDLLKLSLTQLQAVIFSFNIPEERRLSDFSRTEDQIIALIKYLIEIYGNAEALRLLKSRINQTVT